MLILDYLCTMIITIISGVYLVLVLFFPYALTTNLPYDNLLLSSSAIIPPDHPYDPLHYLSLDITCTLRSYYTCTISLSHISSSTSITLSSPPTTNYTTNTPPYYHIAMFNHILHYHTTSTTHELPTNYP